MTNTNVKTLTIAAAILLILPLVGCSRKDSSTFSGTWLKKSGSSRFESVLTVRQSSDVFTIRYHASGGIETLKLRLDGREHRWSNDNVAKETYQAQLDGDTLLVTKHWTANVPPVMSGTYTEEWSLRDNGRSMVVITLGEQAEFKRASFFRELFTAAP